MSLVNMCMFVKESYMFACVMSVGKLVVAVDEHIVMANMVLFVYGELLNMKNKSNCILNVLNNKIHC